MTASGQGGIRESSNRSTAFARRLPLCIDACAEPEAITVCTRSSVYEIVVLGRDGEVLVRGGKHLTGFERAVFLGSSARDGTFHRLTIDCGLQMRFVAGGRLVITSPVESLARSRSSAVSREGDD